jgi:aryl-alcohol dehydrogenase-like predicted oxidoreductase
MTDQHNNGGPESCAAAAGTVTPGGAFTVNRMGYGAMRLTGPGVWGEPKDRTEARRVLHRALELGVNFIDTADSYGPEVNERLIAECLHPYPAGVVIATKGGLIRPGPGRFEANAAPAHLRQACESSLVRLRVDRIELYQLHSPDRHVPLEDSIGELARLQREGKIRHIGVSNVTLPELRLVRSLVPVVSVQNRYSAVDRSSEDVLAYCQAQGLAFIPWFPLDAGRLADGSAGSSAVAALRDIARDRDITLAQAALAWLLAHSPAMLPIPGTSSVAHLEENIAAAAIHLEPQELARLGGRAS